MRVTRLKLANVRAIKEAEFHFQPGFNLIVGVNGVGKTTVLEALGVCLSATVKQAVKRLTRVNSFLVQDVRIGAEALMVQCNVSIGNADYTYLVHKPIDLNTRQSRKAGNPREQVHDTPEHDAFMGDTPPAATGKDPDGRPLAVYFSTRRAVTTERAASKGSAGGGVPAAYAGAFSDRQLELGEFAHWMRAQESIKDEHPAANRVLEAFQQAVVRFLPNYRNLRVETEDGDPRLMINRGTTALQVKNLSDGERGSLTLVLDLTRRLAQANPEMTDPAKHGEAVVLIDEIDLHLHPKWQRRIVDNLTAAFPKCQFIATTHSPQVIGAVSHTGVTLLIDDGPPIRPAQTFGMDSNWILRHIMEADEREPEIQDEIDLILADIRKDSMSSARKRIAALRSRIGETPDLAKADAAISRAELLGDAPQPKAKQKKNSE